MKTNELKKVLKPLIKQCIKEVIFEEGVLSGIISEVVKGVDAKPVVREQKIIAKPNNGEAKRKIQEQRKIATRKDNWNDFFNALSWFAFPASKRVIVRRIYQEMQHRNKNQQKGRGPDENLCTLVDENGVLIVSCDPSLLELVRNFQWKKLFWERHELYSFTRGLLFFTFHSKMVNKKKWINLL